MGEPMSLPEAIESGDEYEILTATRRLVAKELSTCESGRDIAALSKQMQELTAKIAVLDKSRAKQGRRSSLDKARQAVSRAK